MNKSTNQDYIQIAQFFISNSNKILSINEIKNHFQSRIVDITEEKEHEHPEFFIMNHKFIGQQHYDFSFRDGPNYFGELSIDFINGIFINARSQLFAEGFLANFFGLNRKHKKILQLFTERLGPPERLDLTTITPGVNASYWVDKGNDTHVTLSENMKQFLRIRPYISFGIEQKGNSTKANT